MATVISPKGTVKSAKGSGKGPLSGGRGPGGGPSGPSQTDAYKFGMWLGVGGIAMLFAALTSAYVVRFGEAQSDSSWGSFSLPRILLLSTGILVVSSITFEFARKALRADNRSGFNQWMWLTTALGLGFLACQLIAWRNLRASQVYVSSNPHSGFFYVLTGAHGAHLIFGVLALVFVVIRRNKYSAQNRTAVEVTSIYWHFMDGLWIYLYLLLSFWR